MSAVGFAVGTGRCGTKFFAAVMARDPEIAASHERHPFNDTFHRYCQWYGIAVDDAGFLATKRRAIGEDLSRARYSFESSGFLSLSLRALHEQLGAKILMLVRAPEQVVASYWRKGWYKNDPLLDDPNRPPTLQDVTLPHHSLGRTMPMGAEYERWLKLTRIGKLAWYWNRLNRALIEQAKALPKDATRMACIDAVDFDAFCDIRAFLGAPANVGKVAFLQVKGSRPNASSGGGYVHDWTAQECAEFESEVRPMAEYLGFPWSTEEMRATPRRAHKLNLRDWVGPIWAKS
jgi:hypothetical protein